MGNSILSEGIALYAKKEYGDALAFFLSISESAKVDGMDLAYYIGLCYARLERYDDALLYLEQVVTNGSDYDRILQCRYILAIIYVKSGRKRLADFELNKLLETGYNTANVLSSLAYLHWENQDIETCLDFYSRSLEKDTDNVTALNGMGYVLAEENRDLSLALSYCKKAVSNAPKNPACLDSLGWVYFKLGLFDESRKYLFEAEKLLPESEIIKKHVDLLEKAVAQG
ncbi:MAG: tetratricopeptide repeat protein [Treponema sp.]|nr:tetratricopeptide repeat protein [Treponema sp.]